MKTYVTLAAFVALQAMVTDPGLTQHEEDAAREAIAAYRTVSPIDHHVVELIRGYAIRQYAQNRYGQ